MWRVQILLPSVNATPSLPSDSCTMSSLEITIWITAQKCSSIMTIKKRKFMTETKLCDFQVSNQHIQHVLWLAIISNQLYIREKGIMDNINIPHRKWARSFISFNGGLLPKFLYVLQQKGPIQFFNLNYMSMIKLACTAKIKFETKTYYPKIDETGYT